MATAAFNTIAEIQRLRDAGFEQSQAEAITLSIHAGVTGGVATKEDVERVEERLTADIKALGTKIDTVEERLTADIKAVDTKIDTVEERLTDRIDSVEERLTDRIEALDTKIDLVKETLETKMEKQTAVIGEQIANGFAGVAERQVVQMRWMIGSIIALGAVLVAALTL